MIAENQNGIQCFKCKAYIPPSVLSCPFCNTVLEQKLGPTKTEEGKPEISERVMPDIAPPDTNKIPRSIVFGDIGIIVFILILIFLLITQTGLFNTDRTAIAVSWIEEFFADLKNNSSNYWRMQPIFSPVTNQINVIYVRPKHPNTDLYPVIQSAIEKQGFKQFFKFFTEDFRRSDFSGLRKRYSKESLWLVIIEENSNLKLLYQFSFFSPQMPEDIPSYEQIRTQNAFLLYPKGVISVLGVIILGVMAHFFMLIYVRRLHFQVYEIYQKKRTNAIYNAKTLFNEAKMHYKSGKTAKAIVSLEKAIEINPQYKEARALKKMIFKNKDRVEFSASEEYLLNDADILLPSNLLYLKILGTPYAYQLPTDMEIVAIGRQHRKSDDIGSDLVIRIPGSDEKSLRISRRHLEIHRIDNQYFLVDKSGGNTLLNGSEILSDVVHRIRSGDRIVIGHVLTLEVMIRPNLFAKTVGDIIQVSSPDSGHLTLEKSIGELITEDEI